MGSRTGYQDGHMQHKACAMSDRLSDPHKLEPGNFWPCAVQVGKTRQTLTGIEQYIGIIERSASMLLNK